VGDEKREPFEPGEGSSEPDDRLRERVASARTSISEMLRDAIERLEQQERAALQAAEDRLSRVAAERIDDALVGLGMEKGQLQAEVEGRLERAIERLAGEVGARIGTAQARLEDVAARSIGRAPATPEGGEGFEQAAEAALGSILEAESRAVRTVSEAAEALSATEQQTEATLARIEQAIGRVEAAIAEVGEAERRVRGIEQRAAHMEERVVEAAQTATRAADWEGRMAAAARIEAEAARRISDAERRLLGLITEPGDEPSGGTVS